MSDKEPPAMSNDELEAAIERLERSFAGENILAIYFPGPRPVGWTAAKIDGELAVLHLGIADPNAHAAGGAG